MTSETTKKIPRWASKFTTETWERINELLYKGWRPSDVHRELKLPARCKRSLETHARKYAHRRILAPLTTLRELIVRGAQEAGPDTMEAIRIMLSDAINYDSDPKRRERAVSILLDLFGKAESIGQAQEQAQQQKQDTKESKSETTDLASAFRAVLAERGMATPREGS